MEPSNPQGRVRVVVATTVMLSFISFWRAAAIVLNDLGSSAFYAGGIAEQFVGKSAPWFILAVMLFSFAVRMLYIESSSMFTRGGVYRVVKEAMGGGMAKLSVSALIFDFILTGPISGVAAGLYLAGLVNELLPLFGFSTQVDTRITAMIFGILVTLYFWRRNIKGIHESSTDALRIMYVTTAMVVIMILWSLATLIHRGGEMPPLPFPSNLDFSGEALGWLKPWKWISGDGTTFRIAENAPGLVGLFGLLVAFGHSILAMSGEETLAQVNRELEAPKLKNLWRAGIVIFIYSLLFTSLVSFFAVAIIPDEVRPQYLNNLISGLAMNFVGPHSLKLLFQVFVVLVGFLMLSGAVNTAIIGSNGVLNRISEDGVLTEWFRAPHRKYGTTYRLVNMVVILQIFTIVGSGGDIFILGEAYAFGVIWSFSFNALATLLLRFKRPEGREWRVPLNLRLGRTEIPIGVMIVTLSLLSVALTNLLTKQVATIAGICFTAAFFLLFTISERINRRRQDLDSSTLDQFQLQHSEMLDQEVVGARPGNVLVAVRDYNTLSHLEYALERTNPEERDIVVMTVRLITGPEGGERDLSDDTLFTRYEQQLFTRVVGLAEKHGKKVELTVVPSNDVFDALALTAQRLDSADIVTGLSSKMDAPEQARLIGRSWERLREKPRRQVWFKILGEDGREHSFCLGAHAPQLTEDDVNLVHKIWLQVSKSPGRRRVHHRDVVRVALNRLDRDLRGLSDAMLDFYKLEHGEGEAPHRPGASGRQHPGGPPPRVTVRPGTGDEDEQPADNRLPSGREE
ncbi:MAG: APC family permease [Acidobacteria bacterium]|nr:APC family permease [Acidobacteriota bacterium]